MKTRFLTCVLTLGTSILMAACGQTESQTTSGPENPPVQPSLATPASTHQQMQNYFVIDEQAQMPIFAISGPAGWTLASDVQWNLNNTMVPVTFGAMLTDAQETRRLQMFPIINCHWKSGVGVSNTPGQMSMGSINLAPMEPKSALVEAVTQFYQADVPGLQVTGVREVPGLPAALGQAYPNVTGVGLRAVFTWEGKRFEEEIYGLYFISSATGHGELGVLSQTNWGLTSVHGFITQEGQLDANRNLFTNMVRSVSPNRAWFELRMKIEQELNAQFQQKLADNRRSREGIMAQSRALAADNEAFRANIMQRHRAAMDTTAHDSFIAGINSGGSSSSGMSAQEKYVDSIHDRETFNDSSTVTGTSQHGYADHHWSDGWGNYVHTDNSNVDPNLGSTIQWEQLQRVD